MSHPPFGKEHEGEPQGAPSHELGKREREERDRETERVRELLARTVRFLTRCAEDPKAAMDSEDPRDLIRGLENLAVAPEPAPAPEVEEGRPPIQIRRRRSA